MLSFILFEQELLNEDNSLNYIKDRFTTKFIFRNGKYYSKPEYSPNGIPYEITPKMLDQYKKQNPTQTKFLNGLALLGGFLGGYKIADVEGNTIKHLLGNPQVFQDYPQTSELVLKIGLGIPAAYGLYKSKSFMNDNFDVNNLVSERMKKKQ